ncbi:hypothetical protein RB195_020752 [Necator americanus]|uniref:Uncharacterized protein n=1 Tax=Necator americanus TaxID=51031 RepID=A0ABR1CMI9_NECAM
MHDRWIIILSLFPVSVYSLSCYICGDSNLDEFGECATQFQYDCQSYASRFPTDETIYCRTTRHRAANNTFTVMKECISEQDHYHTFPNKGYPIDEECDLVDVQGEEVAYCLCRNQNLCNKPPIADQFIAFEEKHPELFGDDPAVTSSIPSGPAPLAIPHPNSAKVGFGAPQVPLPPIIPINDPRAKTHVTETDIRRAQLPIREKVTDAGLTAVEPPVPPPENMDFFKLSPAQAGQAQFVGSIGMNRHAVAVQPSSGSSNAPKAARMPTELKCAQCGQSGLRTLDADCERQTVTRCQESDAVCFTRQIIASPGQNAIEKMCVSWQAVQAEFPSATMDSCDESNDGRVRYCTCRTDECNFSPISLQISKDFPEELSPQIGREQSEHAPIPSNPALQAKSSGSPPAPPPEPPRSIIAPLPPSPPRIEEVPTEIRKPEDHSQEKTHSSPHFHEEDNGKGSEPLGIREELVRPNPNALPPPIQAVQSNQRLLRCSACVESGITDPTADCSSTAPALCSAQEEYCLTKQTQNDDGSFTMEKRCADRESLASLTDSSEAKSGCSTAGDGMINYCLCQGDLCNKDSLLAQAQISGVRKPESSSRPKTPSTEQIQRIDPPKPAPPNMPTVFLDKDEPSDMATALVPTIRITDEEKELIARQKEWAEADLTGGGSSPPLKFIFLSTFLIIVAFL